MFKILSLCCLALASSTLADGSHVSASGRPFAKDPLKFSPHIRLRGASQAPHQLESHELALLIVSCWLLGVLFLICLILSCKQSVDHGGWGPCLRVWLHALCDLGRGPYGFLRGLLLRLWWWAARYYQASPPTPATAEAEDIERPAPVQTPEDVELSTFSTYCGMRVVTSPHGAEDLGLQSARPVVGRLRRPLSPPSYEAATSPTATGPSTSSPSPSYMPVAQFLPANPVVPQPGAGYIRMQQMLPAARSAPNLAEVPWYERPLVVIRNPNV